MLNFGVKMDEKDKSLLLLCSLPGSYDLLVMILLYEKETLHFEGIVSVLRSKEQREWLTKDGVPQEDLTIGERPRREKERGKQKGWSKSQKGKKEAR